MVEEWTNHAACRGVDPEIFYPDRDDDVEPALAICADCPVREPCLEWALRTREDHGVFGGVSADRRRHLLRAASKGHGAYMSALGAEVAELGRRVAGHEDDRLPDPEKQCSRCPRMIPAGVHPIDRNGDGATCGVVSTYNKGCRCEACSWGKARANMLSAG